MSKYKEIFKLKKMLEDANIPFDWIENRGYGKERIEKLKQISPKMAEHYQICYPSYKKRVLSAIEGFSTYGEVNDLIEIMGLLTPEEEKDDEVVGWLTAEDVFNRIKKHYEKERMNNDICLNENKCKDCEDRYTEVLEQVQALPIQWQMEIADEIYRGQGYKTRRDIIVAWLEKHIRDLKELRL